MQIRGKSIRSLTKYLPQIGDGRPFRIGVAVTGREERFGELGFPQKLEAGLSILPTVVGKVSEFNSQGRDIVRKDRPKITKPRMVYATWNDWHGYPHSGIQYRDYKVYPREHIEGPEEELTLVQRNAELIAVSAELSVKPGEEARAIHTINLFLELFDECELLDKDVLPIVKVRKVNWRILPPGEYPWEKAKGNIQKITSHLKDTERPVVEYRIEHITRNKPDLVAIGTGGFDGYFVFGFTKKDIFVLECTHLDNATYVLKSDWQSLSCLSKKEIIIGNLHHERLIHNARWSRSLHNAIG